MRLYVFAGLLGLIVGLEVIAVYSVVPFWSTWFIPHYDMQYFMPASRSEYAQSLTNLALFYRFCFVLTDRGFQFFVWSVGIALTLAKFSKAISRSAKAQVVMVGLVACIPLCPVVLDLYESLFLGQAHSADILAGVLVLTFVTVVVWLVAALQQSTLDLEAAAAKNPGSNRVAA